MFGYPFNKPRAESPLFPLRIGLWNSLRILCLLFEFMHVGKAVLVVICTDHRLWRCLSQGRDTIYLLLSIKLHVVIVCGKKNLWIRLLLVEWNKPSMTELTPGSGWRFNILDLYKQKKNERSWNIYMLSLHATNRDGVSLVGRSGKNGEAFIFEISVLAATDFLKQFLFKKKRKSFLFKKSWLLQTRAQQL